MKKDIIMRLTQGLLLTASVGLAVCRLEAADVNLFGTNMPPLEFHGFISQGFLYSPTYNYLTPETKHGSFQFNEFALNTTIVPFKRTRISAQAFMFDLGNTGNHELFLDYASVDHSFSDEFGVRAGRIVRPFGIYNSIQDIDVARTSILLPPSIYPPTYRDFYTTLDGGSLYGNIGLKKAGGLSYEFYGGMISPSFQGGAAHSGGPSIVFSKLDGVITGGQLWWYTPVNGLRAGVGAYHLWFDFEADSQDLGHLSGSQQLSTELFSLEYTRKKLTLQAEFETYQTDSQLNVLDMTINSPTLYSMSWYVGVSYQINKWFQPGIYYTEYYPDMYDMDGSQLPNPSDAYHKDLAATLRFDITEWLTTKVEVHYIRGTGEVNPFDNNSSFSSNGWFLLALKVTVSF